MLRELVLTAPTSLLVVFCLFSSQSSLIRWKHDRKLLPHFQNAEQCTMLCLPKMPQHSSVEGRKEENLLFVSFFQLL